MSVSFPTKVTYFTQKVLQSNLCKPNTNFEYIRKMDKNSINMMQLLGINFRATYWI